MPSAIQVAAARQRTWTLRTHLSVLLLVSMALTVVLAGAAVLLYRLPHIAQASQKELQDEVMALAGRVELLLGTREERLALLDDLVAGVSAQRIQTVLDQALHRDKNFPAVYAVSEQGRVTAVGLPDALRPHRRDLIGSDLSSSSLFRAVAGAAGVGWTSRFRSPVSGRLVLGVAYRANGRAMLIGEVPTSDLLQALNAATGQSAAVLWVVNHEGEVIADTSGADTGKTNIRNWPLMQDLLQGRTLPPSYRFPDGEFRLATAHSPALGWYFIARAPLGLASSAVRSPVLVTVLSSLACLVVGLLIAPFWARSLAQPLQELVGRATRTMQGAAREADWPLGPVDEFNQLSHHLTAMAAALKERELKFQAIFNGAPVPMVVTDVADGYRVLDANAAWSKALGYRREDALGRNAVQIGVLTQAQVDAGQKLADVRGAIGEMALRRADGARMDFLLYSEQVQFGEQAWQIRAYIDLGPMRQTQQALHDLNQELEQRVQQRSAALASSNDELSQTVAQLRTAQQELLRTEKMAALGGLVAGVAHELNTPLGNGVLAVSGVAEAARDLGSALRSGLKRSALRHAVQGMVEGTDIARRNLRRAATLVRSFKQVTMDQTSDERRPFQLHEVVQEIVVSLAPSFAHQPWQVDVDVPAHGLRLDSYPGALGQTLVNLIQNAIVHGFEGRDHGTVRITGGHTAGRMEDGVQQEARIWLRVADDGRGIPAAHIGRVFDPFMTTRMGRGGTGLGLHISYNAVVNLLGGTLSVHSVEGQGTCFELQLPSSAPQRNEAAPA